MKKTLFSIALLAMATMTIVGCKSKDYLASNEKKYQSWVTNNPDCQDGTCYMVSGRMDEPAYNGHMVYLATKAPVMDEDGIYIVSTVIDSAVVTDQTFTFKGKTPWSQLAIIRSEDVDDRYLFINLVLEPGSTTAVITSADSTDFIGGTEANNRYQAFQEKKRAMESGMEKKYAKTMERLNEIEELLDTGEKTIDDFDSVELENLINEYMEMSFDGYQQALTLYWDLYHENEQNALSFLALNELRALDENFEDKEYIVNMMPTASKDSRSLLEMMLSAIEAQEKAEAELRAKQDATSEGRKYINVNGTLQVKEGDQWKSSEGSLKDLIDGKVAVVDFWASWCGPCRREIKETLLGLHEKYKNQGVVVVGLDVWDMLEAHDNAVEELGITYPQLIDIDEVSTEIYGIEGIPTIFVIAPDGTILGRDLRGEEIEEAVLRALNK